MQRPDGLLVQIQKTLLKFTEQQILLPPVQFKNGKIIPAKTIVLSFLENMIDEIKVEILKNTKLSAKSRLFIENAYVMIMQPNHTTICAGVHLNHGFIRIGSSFLSVLDFRNQEHLNCLKMILYHEFCHIFFDDTSVLNNLNQQIQSMPCSEVPQSVKATVQENGFELDHETTKKKTFANLLSIHSNVIFKHNERRADIFAAQFVGANDFAIALKTLHFMLEHCYCVDKNLIGCMDDAHDSLAQRLALLDLYQSGIVSLNLETGNIELADKKVLSAIELKTMIEEREKALLTDSFTVIKRIYIPHKQYYIAEKHVVFAMSFILCACIGRFIYIAASKANKLKKTRATP